MIDLPRNLGGSDRENENRRNRNKTCSSDIKKLKLAVTTVMTVFVIAAVFIVFRGGK